MAGDWVLIKRTPSCEYPYKICSINNYSILGEEYADWIEVEAGEEINLEEIKPIPLTAEILEKNGFTKSNIFVEWKYEEEGIYILWKPFPFLKIETENVQLNLSGCEYVHELQHAFKDCGIEKEIVL